MKWLFVCEIRVCHNEGTVICQRSIRVAMREGTVICQGSIYVTMREGTAVCQGSIREGDRGSGFPLSHTKYVPLAFCLKHLILVGVSQKTQYRTGCVITPR